MTPDILTSGGIGRGTDAPYPGMIDAFEAHYGQSFADKDWRNETGIWAAAWGYATRQAGAHPQCKWPTCHSTDYQDELCQSLIDGRIDVPKGWQIVRVDAADAQPVTDWSAA